MGFLAEQDGSASEGPITDAAPQLPVPRTAATGRRLRALMLEAAAKMAAQEPVAAAGVYEQACTLCSVVRDDASHVTPLPRDLG